MSIIILVCWTHRVVVMSTFDVCLEGLELAAATRALCPVRTGPGFQKSVATGRNSAVIGDTGPTR
jgi:hypothetical protein